jgi:hypothetical protein
MNGCRACSFSDRARDPGRGAPARECAGALILVQRELMRVQHLMDVHLVGHGYLLLLRSGPMVLPRDDPGIRCKPGP